MENTKKMPFSSGSEFLSWQSINCDKCDQYESKSTERNEAKCKYAFDLEIAQISGEIPVSTLNYFGYAEYYRLANCPRLYCGRIKDYNDLKKAQEEADKNKKNELPLEF